jgi:thiamine-phosphate pyrophosphorylase
MPDTEIYRVLDASLNRAGEGLRVVEDYARFVLDDPFLTLHLKELRHDFAALAARIPSDDRHAARETLRDVGTGISNATEATRGDSGDVCTASMKRIEQSLRSIEEFGKLVDASFARQAESLRYRLYTLEKAIHICRSSQSRLKDVRLCVLIGGLASTAVFERMIDDLVEARVGMIQLRDKSLADRELLDRARLLRQRTRGTETLCIINDRADIAAAIQADGVHLGQEDLAAKDARAIVGTRMLIGISTHSIEQARRAVLDGANYLGAGPTFPSQTKDFEAFSGVDYLRQVAAEVRLPTFAIGGITARNIGEVLAAGVTRVAVGAAVIAAEKPSCAARELLDMLDAAKHMAAEAASPS